MSQDLYQYAHDQLTQAIQKQADLAQEESIRALHDFVPSMIGEIDSFYCDDTEYHLHYLDGVIPVYVPYEDPQCDACTISTIDAKTCDICGDTLCDNCCYLDENIAFCFTCWTERQSEDDEI